mmetsp:Transcript_25291/g.29285  ORF Transcript_25291/g.29285 Transcript_25291/m.29285 type:complete len:167 (-) Transcript_25291:13-513(-)
MISFKITFGCAVMMTLLCNTMAFTFSNNNAFLPTRPKQRNIDSLYNSQCHYPKKHMNKDSQHWVLFYKNLQDHEEREIQVGKQDVIYTTTAKDAAVSLPRSIDLPKSSFVKHYTKEVGNEKQELLLSFEMLIGRVAMTMALFLIMEEVSTGLSLLDILHNLVIGEL